MPKLIINGFPKETVSNGAPVKVFLSEDYNEVFIDNKSNVDEKGFVRGFIPDKFIGKEIVVRFIDLCYKIKDNKKIIDERGVFLTIHIEKDYIYKDPNIDCSKKFNFDVEAVFSQAQKDMENEIRKSNYKNTFIRCLLYLLMFASPILGFFIVGLLGVIVGQIVNVILLLMDPYITGIKKFRFFKK